MTRLFVLPAGQVQNTPACNPERLTLQRHRRQGRHGRLPRWIPRAITQADINRGQAILEEWGPNHKDADRVKLNYETMCQLSGMDPKSPLAAIGFLGQMANAGLGPGSADTYVGYVHKK